LLNCIKESDITEYELEKHTAEGIGNAAAAGAEAFNHLMIPGYSAWASGGDIIEIINSAGSDIILTLTGGKVIKIAWRSSQLVFNGGKALFKYTPKIIEIPANKVPYNPRAIEQMLKSQGTNVVSHTMPELTQPNVKLAGLLKERVIMTDPVTQKPIIQRVTFDERGFPVFDPYVKLETKILGDLETMSGGQHMKAATLQLKADIEAGKVNKNLFTEAELLDTVKGRAKIGVLHGITTKILVVCSLFPQMYTNG
jgi:hypothetical protein